LLSTHNKSNDNLNFDCLATSLYSTKSDFQSTTSSTTLLQLDTPQILQYRHSPGPTFRHSPSPLPTHLWSFEILPTYLWTLRHPPFIFPTHLTVDLHIFTLSVSPLGPQHSPIPTPHVKNAVHHLHPDFHVRRFLQWTLPSDDVGITSSTDIAQY
jgi:hypothetical protein